MADVTKVLRLRRVVGHYITAIDEDAQNRWFDIRKHPCVVDEAAQTVTVTLPDYAWANRQRQDYTRPPVEIRTRKCLRCRQLHTMDKNQFICNGCRGSAEYREGMVYANSWC